MHIVLRMEPGGLETLVMQLCLKMQDSLFVPEVLCLQQADAQFHAPLDAAGIPVRVMRKRHRFDFSYFFRVARLLRKRRIDIIHAHSGCFFYSAIFALLAGVSRFIFTAHGLPILNGVKDRVEDNLAALTCDRIVAVSEEINSVLRSRMPFARQRITTLINGIDTERFRPFSNLQARSAVIARYGLPEDARWIGSVGRLDPVKNYPMLLRVFARLAPADPLLRLMLVGDGTERCNLETMTRDLGIAERVDFLGMQYHVEELLPLLDAFVLTSVTEGTSISLLEAQACGVPAIVTNVGGNGFIIRSGENGFLCEVNDDTAMSEALCRLRNEPGLAGRMRLEACRRVLEDLNLDAMVQKYNEFYQSPFRLVSVESEVKKRLCSIACI